MATAPHDNNELPPPSMDYEEHERTFNAFITGTKWAIVVLAITVVLLFIIIRP